ncbi:MAG: hypothetical protein IRZ07_04340 [Microbispora sp.]|nr:hypothetical protein [Microbispora sp.]
MRAVPSAFGSTSAEPQPGHHTAVSSMSPRSSHTSWFASFGPVKKPKYVVVVVVSQGGTGGTTAAPAAREIWEGIAALRAR